MIPRRKLTLRLVLSTTVALSLLLLAAPVVRAEDPPTPTPAAGTPAAGDGDWQPMKTQMLVPGESYEATTLVRAAYGFIWVMVAGFVFTVWRRAGRLDKEIESLRAQIKQKTGGG